MIEVRNLTLQRQGACVIDDVSFTISSGTVLGVLGTNGAGKSTLIAGLSGELAATQGQVLLNEKPLSEWSTMQRACSLAVLPQSSSLNFSFEVEEIVAFGRLPHNTGVIVDKSIVQEVMELVDVEHLAKRSYLALSGGEQQRVHLARVLAQLWPINQQAVLLLDEPASMLDPLHQHKLLKIIKGCAKQGAAIFIILHDLNLAAAYCDELLMLQASKIFIQGTPHKVLTAEHVKQVFGLDVFIQHHPQTGFPLVVPQIL